MNGAGTVYARQQADKQSITPSYSPCDLYEGINLYIDFRASLHLSQTFDFKGKRTHTKNIQVQGTTFFYQLLE